MTMLAVIAVVMLVVGGPVVLFVVVDAARRGRAAVITRQIMLTDAIHAELGALVAPVVEKRPFRAWRVILPLPFGHDADAGRLIAITDRVLGPALTSPRDLRIEVTRAA